MYFRREKTALKNQNNYQVLAVCKKDTTFAKLL